MIDFSCMEKNFVKTGCAALLAFLLSGCNTIPSTADRLSLSAAQRIAVKVTTKRQVGDQFGSPSKVEVGKLSETWTYTDKHTESQRMTVDFDKTTGIAESVVWIPDDKSEIKLSEIKSKFPGIDFQKIAARQDQHFISAEVTYSDRDRGISIVGNEARDSVQAVGWKAVDMITPAAPSN